MIVFVALSIKSYWNKEYLIANKILKKVSCKLT